MPLNFGGLKFEQMRSKNLNYVMVTYVPIAVSSAMVSKYQCSVEIECIYCGVILRGLILAGL